MHAVCMLIPAHLAYADNVPRKSGLLAAIPHPFLSSVNRVPIYNNCVVGGFFKQRLHPSFGKTHLGGYFGQPIADFPIDIIRVPNTM
jgi:hypothetical protein